MSREIQPGKRFLDRYVVRKVIAEGGMATIFQAYDERSGIDVAIKRLYTYYMDNEVIRARFVEEGRIQQMLVHPNIVKVYEIVEHPVLSIIMEFVPGSTLDEYLAERGPLDEKDILDVIIPVMSAVGFAHQTGIIHRDIKPSNIIISQNRDGLQPKVMDFGVAKVQGGAKNLTATGTTVGTLHYMSPEQIVGSKNIDGRADLYSIGVTLYKLTTGEVPFNAPTEFALMMAQVEAPPLPPSKLRPGIAPEMEAIILRAMAKKPKDRFQTIREFTTALLNSSFAPSQPAVRDTVTDRIPLDILQYAMQADQVGQDRTAEMNLRISSDGVLKRGVITRNHEVETLDLKQRQLGRREIHDPGDPTEELSASSIIQLSSQDLIQSPYDMAAKTQEMPKTADTTRPSRPSTVLGDRAFMDDAIETESLAQRIKISKLEGHVVFDQQAHSRDLTAPRVSNNDYERILGRAREEEAARSSGPVKPLYDDERTFEKPNYRTENPGQFTTSKPKIDRLLKGISDRAIERPAWQSGPSEPVQSDPATPYQSGPSVLPQSGPSSPVREAGSRLGSPAKNTWGTEQQQGRDINIWFLGIGIVAAVVILATATYLLLHFLWT